MSPRRLVLGLLAVGLGLLAVGAALFFVYVPHYETGGCFVYADWDGGGPCLQGDLRAAMAGAAIAGAGFLVVLVPIVAWGVRLGRLLGAAGGD